MELFDVGVLQRVIPELNRWRGILSLAAFSVICEPFVGPALADLGVSVGQSHSSPAIINVKGFSLASSRERLCLDGLSALTCEATGRDGSAFSESDDLSSAVLRARLESEDDY